MSHLWMNAEKSLADGTGKDLHNSNQFNNTFNYMFNPNICRGNRKFLSEIEYLQSGSTFEIALGKQLVFEALQRAYIYAVCFPSFSSL